MKRLFFLAILAILIYPALFLATATAQDEARPSWQLTGFDIAANVQQSERALTAVAVLTIRNVGRAAGSGLTLRINSKAVVNSITSGGANVTLRTLPEPRGNMQRVNLTLPSPVTENSTTTLTVNYRLPVESNSGIAAISPIGSQFLPLSFWYPVLNTQLTVRGADTAPFKLKVEGGNVISSGFATGQVYDQPLSAQPFFLQGEWDQSDGAGDAKGISAYLPKQAPADERKQAEAMIGAAASARSFYASLLGPAPEIPIRLVAVRRGAGFSDGGAVLIERGAFRRTRLDAATAMLIAESLARAWIGAQTPIRGEGSGMLRDSQARYFAILFVEKQFGREAADAELRRQRTAFAAVSKRDAPISRLTQLDDTYYSTAPNKGAMVWRLVERRIGRDALIGIIKTLLLAGKGDPNGTSLAALRAGLGERGGAALKTLLDQELDQPTDLDLMIGLPQQRGAEWVAALRNVGSIEATVAVAATTDRGEVIKVETNVPAHNFADAVFKTTSKVVRVEVDPEKLYPQIDYANDVAPRVRAVGEAIAEATRFMGAQDYARVETITREILTAAPRMEEARILLARALLGQDKLDEAEKLFRSALDEVLPAVNTLAWANIGLGEIALRKGQAAEAARRFNDGVRAEGEYATQLAGRAGRIKAEASPTVDESIRTFVGQIDRIITTGTKAELDARIVPGELVRFVGGIVGSKPEVWQTRVLRTEQLDGNLAGVDVSINAKALGKEASGTALLILARLNGAWRLAAVELSEVR